MNIFNEMGMRGSILRPSHYRFGFLYSGEKLPTKELNPWEIKHSITILEPSENQRRILKKESYEMEHLGWNIIIDLTKSKKQIASMMEKKKARKFRKINNARIYVPNRNNMHEFYKLYKELMKSKGLKPLDKGMIMFLKEYCVFGRSGNIIHLYLLNGKRVIHMLTGGISKTRESEEIHLLAIKYFKKNNYNEYDLGSSKADWDDSLTMYKLSLGGEPNNKETWVKRNIYSQLYKRLKHEAIQMDYFA